MDDATEEAAMILEHSVHTGTPLARFARPTSVVTENVYAAGARSHRHAHESPFINFTLSGRSRSFIGSLDPIDCGPGDIHYIPAGVEHSHRTESSGLCGIAIDLRPEYLDLFRETGADFSQPFARTNSRITRLATRLQQEIRDPDPLSHFQVDAIIADICVSLARLRNRSATAGTPRWLKQIVTETCERYKEDITLEGLAADAHVHPAHVSRAFRRAFGETLRDHIRRMRIQEARRLLASTALPIAQIAVEVGYHDESHFAKAFKRVVGATPGAYRSVVRRSPKILP